VTDLGISECVTESVSVNSMEKSDGGNAPLESAKKRLVNAKDVGSAVKKSFLKSLLDRLING
jgi:hypothetical protein